VIRLCVLLALASCTSPTPITVCPPITNFPVETQRQARAELLAPPPKPALGQIVRDWVQMRDRLRRCGAKESESVHGYLPPRHGRVG
jgi:hypothetical protein